MRNYGSYNVEINNKYMMVISVGAMVIIILCLLVLVLCLRHQILLISNHCGRRDDHNSVDNRVGGSGTKGFDEATLDSCQKMLF